jgi:hypothetical protein
VDEGGVMWEFWYFIEILKPSSLTGRQVQDDGDLGDLGVKLSLGVKKVAWVV